MYSTLCNTKKACTTLYLLFIKNLIINNFEIFEFVINILL